MVAQGLSAAESYQEKQMVAVQGLSADDSCQEKQTMQNNTCQQRVAIRYSSVVGVLM